MFAYCSNSPLLFSDPTGTFGWFTFANFVIGATVGAATQIAANLVTGEKWYEGVAGAAVGGGIYNVVTLLTRNVVAASAASTAAESITNELVSYATGEKELSMENVKNSFVKTVTDVAANVATTVFTGKAAEKLVKTNAGWFQPRKFASSFTGKYARRVWKQTLAQGGMQFGFKIIRILDQ